MRIWTCWSHSCSLPANCSAIKEAHLQISNLLGRMGNIEWNQSSVCLMSVNLFLWPNLKNTVRHPSETWTYYCGGIRNLTVWSVWILKVSLLYMYSTFLPWLVGCHCNHLWCVHVVYTKAAEHGYQVFSVWGTHWSNQARLLWLPDIFWFPTVFPPLVIWLLHITIMVIV
jgi:hypothetical protein